MTTFEQELIDELNEDTTSLRQKEKEKYRKKRKSAVKYKRHLKNLAQIPQIPSGAIYKDSARDKTKKPRYARSYRGSRSAYIKRQCNRKIRRSKMLLQRGLKNRFTEFWWEYD